MLAERADALHVFCYASRSALIARVRGTEGISDEDAAKLVDDTNAQREQWVRKHWNRAWREHSNYHLSVNTELLGIARSADAISSAARAIFGLADAGTPDGTARISPVPEA